MGCFTSPRQCKWIWCKATCTIYGGFSCEEWGSVSPRRDNTEGMADSRAKSGALRVSPRRGSTNGIDAGLHVRRWAVEVGTSLSWGDNHFYVEKRTWMTMQQPERCDKPCQRASCQFIIGLIAQLMRATMNDHKGKYTKMMETPNFVLEREKKQLVDTRKEAFHSDLDQCGCHIVGSDCHASSLAECGADVPGARI